MTTERDRRTRIVLSWLREDTHEHAQRVLLLTLDEVDTTPQRRSWWPAWRFEDMNKLALTAAAAAAALAIAVVGYNLLPGLGIGGPGARPTPTPALLARGTFTVPDANVTEINATGDGAGVTGTMIVSDDGGRISVDLECERTTPGGLLIIGGSVSDSNLGYSPKGSLFAIILRPGSPVLAGFMFDDASRGPCPAFLSGDVDAEAGPGLKPIEGNVELRP